MSEELIVRQCAPTLAGLKTGSIFNCPYRCRKSLLEGISKMNTRLSEKGLRFIPLRISESQALIYIYRPEKLKKDLSSEEAADILNSLGYTCPDMHKCLSRLRERLKGCSDFPHEIGLFLGYPPEDVKGFIENRASGHKLSGYWKVYGDTKRALKTFALYKKCTRVYVDRCACGTSVERLAVAC